MSGNWVTASADISLPRPIPYREGFMKKYQFPTYGPDCSKKSDPCIWETFCYSLVHMSGNWYFFMNPFEKHQLSDTWIRLFTAPVGNGSSEAYVCRCSKSIPRHMDQTVAYLTGGMAWLGMMGYGMVMCKKVSQIHGSYFLLLSGPCIWETFCYSLVQMSGNWFTASADTSLWWPMSYRGSKLSDTTGYCWTCFGNYQWHYLLPCHPPDFLLHSDPYVGELIYCICRHKPLTTHSLQGQSKVKRIHEKVSIPHIWSRL